MNIQTLLDFKPETKSFLDALIKSGFKLLRGNNGGDEDFKFEGNLETFLDELVAADDASLWVFDPTLKRERWIYFVYGNNPGELVSDYSVPRDESDTDNLSPICDAHSNEWESKPQPKKTGYYGEGGKWIDTEPS